MWTLKNRPINMGGEERGGLQTMLPLFRTQHTVVAQYDFVS